MRPQNTPKFWRVLRGDPDPFLVGYKGKAGADVGAFYCPYIPIMKSQIVPW